MDVRLVTEEREWDHLRLVDINQPAGRASYGGGIAHRIISRISSHIPQCRSIQDLVLYLERRRVVASKAGTHLMNVSNSEAANSLQRLLIGMSQEPGSGAELIHGLYLALLDCYEETGDSWCHRMAISALRVAVRKELNLPDINVYDMTHVFRRVPNVHLEADVASKLMHELGLSRYGSPIDLSGIMKVVFNAKLEFQKLVSGLLLTKHTGRYLSLFLPYCHSNPPIVYDAIQVLGSDWRRLALYIGYSETEVAVIEKSGGGDPVNQIRMFMRVWWMPDCGPQKTRDLLNQLMIEKLGLVDELHSGFRQDDGISLLNACQENNWEIVEELVKTGCHLGARNNEGRTPLMLACLKGKEKAVTLLIEHGADIQAMDGKGEACLNYTSTLRNRNILECILRECKRRNASVDVESLDTGCTPLSTACKCGLVPSAVLLLKHDANPNGTTKHRPLVEASAQGHIGLVKTLLGYKANIDATGKLQKEYTALIQACSSSHWGLAELLINEGADVNKCAASDCISPLYVAASANQVRLATKLINKGAIIDSVTFQPGAVEGIIELTPLANAAGKGLDNMVKLLLDNGANINFLCSNTIPAIAFTILGDHVNTFHLLLDNPNLNKTLVGLTSTIVTSVRTDKYYYTGQLLDVFGGPQVVLMQAQQDGAEMLVENVMVYLQAVNHPSLAEVGLLMQDIKAPVVPQSIKLQPGDQEKIDYVLTSFCRICTSVVTNSVQHDSLAEIAQATGSTAAAVFFRQMLSGLMTDQELKTSFLDGEPSPLRFLIENKVLTLESFHIEVLKFHPDDSEVFYQDLVWTFQHMSGGADLPSNVDMMLKRLFSGGFVPRHSSQSRVSSSSSKGDYKGMMQSLPAIHQPIHEPSLEERHEQEKTFQRNLKDTPPLAEKGDKDKGTNPSLPEEPSKALKNYAINYQNNPPSPTTPQASAQNQQSMPQSFCSSPPQASAQNHQSMPQSSHSSSPQQIVQHQTSPSQQLRSQNHSKEDHYHKQPPTSDSSEWVVPENIPLHLRDMAKVKVVDAVKFQGINRKLGEVAEYEEEDGDFCLPNVVVEPTGTFLGQGAYGDVLEVTYRGKIYAAKKYRFMDAATKTSMIGTFSIEQNILGRIRHPNIVPYYGICRHPDGSVVLVMQRLEMNVASYLKTMEVIPLSKKLKILFDVIKGLGHLHKQKPAIIHRDLTGGNVLLDRRGVAKISDFGNSKMVNIEATPEILTTNPGTLDYMPPEATEGEYNEKVDIFSYGHLAVHIMIQKRPYPLAMAKYRVKGELKARTEVERREKYLKQVKTCLGVDQHSFYTLIIQCLQDESDPRPSCEDIISCETFKKI